MNLMQHKSVVIIVGCTVLTLAVWVLADIWHARSQVRPAPQVQELLEPLDPTFDQAAIDSL